MIPSKERKKVNYIGRSSELDRLAAILDEVRSGAGRLVMVSGEAGIGKTRLIQEMRTLQNFSDFYFLKGRCLYFKDTDIYLPFKEMFNQYSKLIREVNKESPFSPRSADEMEGEQISNGGDFVPMSLIPAEFDSSLEEGEAPEMKVEGLMEFDKLSEFIFDLSNKGPLCLFIDDLHWADPPSIKLLQYLSQKIMGHSILIICTYRPEDLFWAEDAPHPLSEPLRRLSRDELYIPIELNRLTGKETSSLIGHILDIDKVPPSFKDLIYKRTNGNPFFIEEVIYSLLERNIIDPVKHGWHKNIDPDTISLPTTLRDIILRRMHWLDANSISVIRLASVSSGTKLTFDIIKDALKIQEEDVLNSIEELVKAKFLKEIGEDESYDFENPVIQEIIYSELNHSRRRFLHNKMANVLEARYSKNPAYWGNIGIHLYKGKDFERALQYLIRASSYYQKISPHKALEYLTMVLFCIENLPQSDAVKEQNLKVLLEISNLCIKIWDWDRAFEFGEKANNLATVLRKPAIRSRARINMANVYRFKGDYDRAEVLYRDIISSHQKEDPETFANAYMGIGYIHWRRGEFPRALEMFSKSLQFAKVKNDMRTIGSLYLNIGNVFHHRGDMKKAIDYYSRGVRHLESSKNLSEASRGICNIGSALLQLEEYDEAEEKLNLSLDKSKEQGGQEFWWPNLLMIQLKTLQMKYDKAEECIELVSDELKSKDDKMANAILLQFEGLLRMKQERTEEAETLFVRSVSLFESLGTPYNIALSKMYLGDLYVRMDRFEEGRDYLSQAHQTFKTLGSKLMVEIARKKLLAIRDGDGFI